MKVFIKQLKAKLQQPNPSFTLREVSQLVIEYEKETARADKLQRQVKRGY